MDLQNFRECLDKRKNGIPIYIGDSIFYGKRFGDEDGNSYFKKLTRELFGPFHKKHETDFDIVFGHWLSEYGIVGWENVTDGKVSYEYSHENAFRIFTNPEFQLSLNKLLFEDLINFENFLQDEVLEDIEDIKKQ